MMTVEMMAVWTGLMCVGAMIPSVEQQHALDRGWFNGVNFGGWLVTEPSWMYDQFSAGAENDLVMQWRKQGGDDFAIQTFKNHWGGYIPDSALDTIQDFGITHVRLPVGYWIVDAPVNPGATMYDYGFQEEGFVTGGINHLETMLTKLKERNIKGIIDLHAVPGGGSACQSYGGVMENDPKNSFWQGTPHAGPHDGGCSNGGPYTTTRSDTMKWMQVGESSMLKLANWVVGLQSNSSLSDTVVGIEMVNEPGLGWGGMQTHIEDYLSRIVPQVQSILSKAGLSDVAIDVNFIGPNDADVGRWLVQQKQSGAFAASPSVDVDFHNYYNWDGTLSFSDLAQKICDTSSGPSGWRQYSDAKQYLWIGEWSDATNLDNPAFTNLDDPAIAANLAILHANQMSLYYSSPGVIGQFYWSVRMGSGWQPWPTADCPNGCQVSGSSPNQSLPGFHYRVWNLLELIAHKVALPLSQYQISGQCKCNGCNSSPPAPPRSWSPGSHCMYSEGCDFPGHDVGNMQIPDYQCSDACYDHDGCSIFSWTDFNGGTCWFKDANNQLGPDDASSSSGICGIMSFVGTWKSADDYVYAQGCDFIQNDLSSHSSVSSGADCAKFCAANSDCTNFVWISDNTTCLLKRGGASKAEAIPAKDSHSLCGIMN